MLLQLRIRWIFLKEILITKVFHEIQTKEIFSGIQKKNFFKTH